MFMNSFKPRLLQTLMAEGATEFGGDVRKIKRGMEVDAARAEDRQANLAERTELDTAKRAEADRGKRMAQIEGESGLQYNTRMQNQAWNPKAYGDDYRSSFKKQSASPEMAAVDEENRRRKRLSMAMSSPASGEDY